MTWEAGSKSSEGLGLGVEVDSSLGSRTQCNTFFCVNSHVVAGAGDRGVSTVLLSGSGPRLPKPGQAVAGRLGKAG